MCVGHREDPRTISMECGCSHLTKKVTKSNWYGHKSVNTVLSRAKITPSFSLVQHASFSSEFMLMFYVLVYIILIRLLVTIAFFSLSNLIKRNVQRSQQKGLSVIELFLYVWGKLYFQLHKLDSFVLEQGCFYCSEQFGDTIYVYADNFLLPRQSSPVLIWHLLSFPSLESNFLVEKSRNFYIVYLRKE